MQKPKGSPTFHYGIPPEREPAVLGWTISNCGEFIGESSHFMQRRKEGIPPSLDTLLVQHHTPPPHYEVGVRVTLRGGGWV